MAGKATPEPQRPTVRVERIVTVPGLSGSAPILTLKRVEGSVDVEVHSRSGGGERKTTTELLRAALDELEKEG